MEDSLLYMYIASSSQFLSSIFNACLNTNFLHWIHYYKTPKYNIKLNMFINSSLIFSGFLLQEIRLKFCLWMFLLVGQCPKGTLYWFLFPKLAAIYSTVRKVYNIDLWYVERGSVLLLSKHLWYHISPLYSHLEVRNAEGREFHLCWSFCLVNLFNWYVL